MLVKSNTKILYHFLAFATIAIWGVTFISTKVLIKAGMDPAHIFAIRFAIAYAGIWVLQLGITSNRRSTRLMSGTVGDELIMLFLGVSGGSIYFLAENTALAHTQACNVSFIVCSAPLLTAILTVFVRKTFKGELVDGLEDVQVRWPLILGTILAFGGMAAVIFDGSDVEFSPKGDLLALGAAICWGIYSLFMSQMSKRYGTMFVTRKVFFYGLLTAIPFLSGTSLDPEIFFRPEVWGNLLFLSIVASLACFVIWNKTMAKLGNVTSTNYVYLNPFFTTVAAVLLLGESLSFQSAAGCIAIIGGVILGGRK